MEGIAGFGGFELLCFIVEYRRFIDCVVEISGLVMVHKSKANSLYGQLRL